MRGILFSPLAEKARRRAAPHIAAEKLVADSGKKGGVNAVRFQETDFHLRRMDVDIDLRGVHFDFEEGDRIAPDHQHAAVRLYQRVLKRFIANETAVQEEVLAAVIAPRQVGMADVAGNADTFPLGFDRDQFGGELGAERAGDPFAHPGTGGQVVDDAAVMPEDEMNIGVRNREPDDSLGNMAELGQRPFEEFPPYRSVEEEVPHLDRCAAPHSAGGRFRKGLPPLDPQFGAMFGAFGTAADNQLADLGDRGERFAAESERADAEKVVGLADFAGGMLRDGEFQLFGAHSAAVVGDADQVASRLFDIDFDLFGAGVERVFDDLFDNARRPFDDLAGGDFIDQGRGQYFDLRHGRIVLFLGELSNEHPRPQTGVWRESALLFPQRGILASWVFGKPVSRFSGVTGPKSPD